jgi:hypothetical protein
MRRFRWVTAALAVVIAGGLVVLLVPGHGSAADTGVPGTLYGCVNSMQRLVNVNDTGPTPCPSGAYPVSWAASVPSSSPSPSPSASSATPTPTATTPTPTPTDTSTPTPTTTATGAACTTTLGNNCGPFSDSANIPMSNGFDTYVGPQNVGSNPGTTATNTVTDPGNWSSVVNALPLGYGGVQIFDNVQQLTNDWNGSGWGNGSSDTPLSSLTSLKINYAESMGTRDTSTSAEFAPDIWTEQYPSDVMFWADTTGRCNQGAYGSTVLGTASIDGQTWTVNRYGGAGAEIIFVLDNDPNVPNSCASQTTGSVDIKAGFDWLISHGILSAATFTQLNTGWEITSAANETFSMSSYSITATAG